MTHPNEDLLRVGFAAFDGGDAEKWTSQNWAEDIRFHIPGRNPFSGNYQGIEQVLQCYGRLVEVSGGTLSLELHDVLANDEHGVALLTARGERAGRQLNDNMVETFHFRDGKVSEVWVQATDLYANDEFWS
jgi:ketosteroid isomerase-like protein